MATEFVYLDGTIKWPKLATPDQFGNYSLNLYPTEESLGKFKALKLKNNVRDDEDGKFITLRRPRQKMMKGQLTTFDPPKVVDSEQNPITELIGNGTEATVKLAVYSYNRDGVAGKGSRLEAIRVNKLVPYQSKRPEDEIVALTPQPKKVVEELPF